jgi:uncharacterized membrane protein
MLAVSGAVGLYYITSRWRLSSLFTSAPRFLWLAGTIFFIGAGLVYPVIASMNRTYGFTTDRYLDGLAAMRAADPSEFEAVRWLEDNVEGTPTILEAIGGDYSAYGRVSSRTGLPTLLGWPDHEYRWRNSWAVQGTRKDDTQRIYQTTSAEEAKELLDKYDMEYVYVGALEREAYGDAGLAKFGDFMDVAFQNSGVTIYHMPDTGQISVRAP